MSGSELEKLFDKVFMAPARDSELYRIFISEMEMEHLSLLIKNKSSFLA